MNRQERRRQQSDWKKQGGNESNEKRCRIRVLPTSVMDILKYQRKFWDFQKYSTANAIRNGSQHSLKDIKTITRIEISSDMYESYFVSWVEHCNNEGTFNGEEYFKFCIPPYDHGVLRIPGQDDLWREWWVSNITETSYDLRIDTYIASNNLYGRKSFVGINDARVVEQAKSCPIFFIRTYSLYFHCYLDNNQRMFDYDCNKCITWDDFFELMFQSEFNHYHGKRLPDQLKSLYNFAKQTYCHSEEEINADGELIINEFSDAIASFNYAAEVNQCVRTKQKNGCYIYEYRTENFNSVSHELIEQRQLSLAVENRNICRIKSNNPNLLKTKIIVKHLKPIIWDRRGHYRHYKNGKTVYVKPAECHWHKYQNTNLRRQNSILRLTDIFAESSSLERLTSQYLDEHNIEYLPQFSFKDLMGDGNVLRFDFAIKQDQFYILIECQGEQHYHPVEIFGGQEQFEKQQRYDKLKADYAHKHGHTLIYIDGRKIQNEKEVCDFLNKYLHV